MTLTIQTTTNDARSGDVASPQAHEPALGSSLASLLDRFTRSVKNTASDTVGEFAATVESLHGELNMLAHHFSARARTQELDELDFDDIFPGDTNIPVELDPAYHGIMASEELEYRCRQMSVSA